MLEFLLQAADLGLEDGDLATLLAYLALQLTLGELVASLLSLDLPSNEQARWKGDVVRVEKGRREGSREREEGGKEEGGKEEGGK